MALCVGSVLVAGKAAAQEQEAFEEAVELFDTQSNIDFDDGRVWEDVSYGTGEASFTAVAIDPTRPDRVYAGANGAVFVSTDGGASWSRVFSIRGSATTSGPTSDGVDVERIVEDEVSDRVEADRDELLEEIKQQITDDLVAELGDYGEELAEEIADELAEQQVADAEDDLFEEVRAEFERNRPVTPNPSEEEAVSDGALTVEPRRIHRILALPGGRVLVATGSGLFESKDAGASFEELQVGIVPAERDVRSVLADPRRPKHMLAGTLSGLYASTDAGETWQEVGGFPEKLAFFDVSADPSDPLRLLVGSNNGVYRSTDGGASFLLVNQPTSPEARITRAVAYDPLDARIAFAGTASGLFRSLNGGDDWERVEAPGLLSRNLSDLVSMPWGLIASSDSGVFLSVDSGESFRELYAGLDSPDVARVAAGQAPLTGFAATGGGLFAYRTPLERAEKTRALAEIRRLLLGEPRVDEVSEKALAYAHVDLPVESWRARATAAAWMPRLTVRWDAIDPIEGPFTFRIAGTTVPPTLYNFRKEQNGVTAQLTWNFRSVLWPTENLNVSRSARSLEKDKTRILRRIVNTYNARRRIQVALIQSPPRDAYAYAQKALQIDELSAVLDGFTDGWFTSAIASGDARTTSRTR